MIPFLPTLYRKKTLRIQKSEKKGLNGTDSLHGII